MQFTGFQRKSLQSPGTFISERTWDPSQKAVTALSELLKLLSRLFHSITVDGKNEFFKRYV